MKTFLQVLSLSSLVLFASCAHHSSSCCGNSSQCEMHGKDSKDKKCCDDKGQCPMKADEHANDHAEAKK